MRTHLYARILYIFSYSLLVLRLKKCMYDGYIYTSFERLAHPIQSMALHCTIVRVILGVVHMARHNTEYTLQKTLLLHLHTTLAVRTENVRYLCHSL